jgi:hypothetical protein
LFRFREEPRFTLVVIDIDGVVVGFVTDPPNPFAVATATFVTEPEPVPKPAAVIPATICVQDILRESYVEPLYRLTSNKSVPVGAEIAAVNAEILIPIFIYF